MTRSILVTGGCGFIGSHFLRLLLRERADVEVRNLDLLTYAGSPANVAAIAHDPRYTFVHGDICDPRAVREAMAGCDAVVHFAAETHVDRSLIDATPFVRTNVEGTLCLLAAAHELGVGRFLHMSTDEVYGDIEAPRLALEDDPLAPRSPYAAAKAGAELQCRAFGISYGLAVVIARGSNVYGENQYPEKLIPLFTSNALRGEPLPVYGDGRQQRDWTYVRDLCEALLVLLEQGRPGLAYNVTAEDVHENLEVVELLLSALGRERSLVRHVADRRGHDRRYATSAARMRELGWRPRSPFADTLARTVRWYAEHRDWWQPLREGDFADYYRVQYGRR